jgi:formate hydrogenlyase subunit 4
VSAWRDTLRGDAVVPGVQEALLTGAAAIAVLAPLIALVLLPVPGNPLVAGVGLSGDLVAEAALLLVVPAMRLMIGWAVASPATRAASDRGARLLAGAMPPMALAVGVVAYQLDTLGLAGAPKASPNGVAIAARVLAAIAFAVVLPVLARTSSRRAGSAGDAEQDELGELAGRDLASFRLAEALQLAAAAAFFIAAFILPIVPGISKGVGYGALWVVGVLLSAVGIGAWEGFTGKRSAESAESAASTANAENIDRPPLTWWLGFPLLLALLALVAASWAVRGL